MKSGAEPRASLFVRGGALFDRVDYRPIETPEEKDQLYQMRYRAYTHGGLIPPSESQRYSDSYDDAPNARTFGIYVDGEICSSIRLQRPDVRTADVLYDRYVRRCSSPSPRSRRGFHRSGPFCCKSRKSPAVSGASLSDAAVGLSGMRVFQRRYRPRAGSSRAPGILSPGLSARDHCRTAPVSERLGEGGIDGVRFPCLAGKGLDAFSHHALKCLRAANAVPAQQRAPFVPGRTGLGVRSRLNRSAAVLSRSAQSPRAFQSAPNAHFAVRCCRSASDRP